MNFVFGFMCVMFDSSLSSILGMGQIPIEVMLVLGFTKLLLVGYGSSFGFSLNINQN